MNHEHKFRQDRRARCRWLCSCGQTRIVHVCKQRRRCKWWGIWIRITDSDE